MSADVPGTTRDSARVEVRESPERDAARVEVRESPERDAARVEVRDNPERDAARVEVRDNPEEGRYEVRADGELVGFARYRLRNGRIVFFHTEIDPGHEHTGLAAQLARFALDDARARGLAVVPLCPFIAGFIRQHPDEYLSLVLPGMRDDVMRGAGG